MADFSCRYFWIASISQRIPVIALDAAPIQREMVEKVYAKINRTEPVMRLVDSAGFSFDKTVGTKAAENIQLPTAITQSCHGIERR